MTVSQCVSVGHSPPSHIRVLSAEGPALVAERCKVDVDIVHGVDVDRGGRGSPPNTSRGPPRVSDVLNGQLCVGRVVCRSDLPHNITALTYGGPRERLSYEKYNSDLIRGLKYITEFIIYLKYEIFVH